MLQKLNERIQGIVAWVVIVLVALTFTMFGVDYYIQSRNSTNVEVEVDGQAISKQTFESSYRRNRQQHDPSQLTAATEKQLKKQVLDDLIVNSVMVSTAHHNGFSITAPQALSAIQSIPQFQEDGHFSSERYEQALSGAFFTPETFQQEVQQGMLLNQQRFVFMGTAFVLPNEVKRFVKLYMQTRDYETLTIPAKQFLADVSVTAVEVAAYLKSHREKFLTAEQVQVSYVELSLADVKKDIVITDDKTKQYYDENESNYTTPAQWKVSHILFAVNPDASESELQDARARAEETQRLLVKDPVQFATLAKKISDDKISAINEGKLPWLVAGQTEFDEALVKLKNVGEISSPIKTRHGFEIFKLLAYKPAELKPYNDVKAEIEEQLLVEMAQAKFAESLEELSDVSYQSPDSLAPVAQALKLKIKASKPFSREGHGDEPLSQNKLAVNAAFSRDVLELGNNSDPIQIDNDSVIVLRVDKHIAAKPKQLAEVTDTIVNKLKLAKALDKAAILGNQLLALQSKPTEMAAVLDKHHLKWQALSKMTRESDKAPTEINELAFNIAKAGVLQGKSVSNGDFVLVLLKRINNGQMVDLDKEQQASLAQQIESNLGMMDYDLYANDLLAKAKIVRH